MKTIQYILVLALVMSACRDKYDLQLKDSDKSLLVVEGHLNAGGTTSIRLTKSYNLSTAGAAQKVSGAQLTVEGSDGTSYSLAEQGTSGVYRNVLNLQLATQYRLRIKLPGKEYLSDFVPVKTSPAIDSVSWKWENDGVMIYTSTHDNTDNSRYYKWEYDETWEINSNYFSSVKIQADTVAMRDLPAESVFRCWKYDSSKTIMLGSSAQLQSDVISNVPLVHLPKNTEKFSVRYSILVKQQVLTKEAFEFFQLMKKNTEQLGSIFDPLPSELRGNIKCLSNPEEQVIGYITASSLQQKRLFISSTELPHSQFSIPGCTSVYVVNKPDSLRKYGAYLMAWEPDYHLLIPDSIVGVHMAPPICVDCAARSGNYNKPSYW